MPAGDPNGSAEDVIGQACVIAACVAGLALILAGVGITKALQALF
jgi:hypothetical protein